MADHNDYQWHLRSLILDIATRVGLPPENYNTWLLTDHVRGISTTNKRSAAAVIETLGDHFLFDLSNWGGVVHCTPRGAPVAKVIDENDLIPNDKNSAKQSSRKDSIGVPSTIHLEYYDLLGGLTADKQTSDRSNSNLRNKADGVTQSTIIMTADEAAQAVVISHKIAIEEQRGEVKFILGDNHIDLICGDVVSIKEQRLRIVKIEIDNGKQTYTALHDRVSAYQSNIQGLPINPPSPPPNLVVAETLLEIVDSHIINSGDDQLGYYVLISSKTFDWSGAVIEISKDGGATWIDSDNSNMNSIFGEVLEVLPQHNHNYPDRTNTLRVKLIRPDMELETSTMREVMNRANLAIVGNELINFMDATQVGEDEWELTGLLRGRKGSPSVAHAVGERFLMMTSGLVAYVPAELFELGRELTFRATSFGLEPGTDKTTIIYQGRSQIERQPAYLKAVRQGANLKVSWQGVGRLGGGMSIGMGAYFTNYRVTLGTTVVNTTDMFATIPHEAGTLMVQQVNQITGAGPAITKVIT